MSDFVIIEKENLSNLANSIKDSNENLSLKELADKANETKQDIVNALNALTEKGIEVPTGAGSNDLAELIAAIESGSGSGMIAVTGTFIPSSLLTSYTITHNLGKVPVAVAVMRVLNDGEYQYGNTDYEMVAALACDGIQSFAVWGRGSYQIYEYSYAVAINSTSKHSGFVYNGNENTVTLSNEWSYGKYESGQKYSWVVIA